MAEGADSTMLMVIVVILLLVMAYHLWSGFFEELNARTRCIRTAILVMYEGRGEMTRTDARNTFAELLPCRMCQMSFDGCWSSLAAWGFLVERSSGLYAISATGMSQLESETDTKKFSTYDELTAFERTFDHRGICSHKDLFRNGRAKASVERP